MATIDFRKLCAPGNSRAITIPRSWAEFYGLKPGDMMVVMTSDKFVLVCPQNIDINTVKRLFEEMCKEYDKKDGEHPDIPKVDVVSPPGPEALSSPTPPLETGK